MGPRLKALSDSEPSSQTGRTEWPRMLRTGSHVSLVGREVACGQTHAFPNRDHEFASLGLEPVPVISRGRVVETRGWVGLGPPPFTAFAAAHTSPQLVPDSPGPCLTVHPAPHRQGPPPSTWGPSGSRGPVWPPVPSPPSRQEPLLETMSYSELLQKWPSDWDGRNGISHQVAEEASHTLHQ